MLNSAKCIAWVLVALGVAAGAPTGSRASDSLERSGDALQVILPAAAYGMTFVYRDPSGRNQFYQSFFTTLAVTYTLKYAVDKERPNGGEASFPSGHTAAAFSGASFIQQRYGWFYGAPAYLAAALVGWSRIETENHYAEDVFAAAVIGTAASWIFTKPYLDKMNVMPFVSDKRFGLHLVFEW